MTFPASPTSGQQATEGGRLYQWNGVNAWELIANVSTHAAAHAAGGSDSITPASIGAAATSHTHAYSSLTGTPTSFAPSAHASMHAANGSDPLTLSASQITGLGSLATASNVAYSSLTGVPTSFTPADGSVTDAKITSGGLSTSSLNWAAIQPWAANTSYAKGDLVEYLGIAYRRSSAGTSGATFNSANWQQITPSAVVSHTHAASAITSGTLDDARLSFTPIHPFLLMGG